jgi:hypothetical protein
MPLIAGVKALYSFPKLHRQHRINQNDSTLSRAPNIPLLINKQTFTAYWTTIGTNPFINPIEIIRNHPPAHSCLASSRVRSVGSIKLFHWYLQQLVSSAAPKLIHLFPQPKIDSSPSPLTLQSPPTVKTPFFSSINSKLHPRQRLPFAFHLNFRQQHLFVFANPMLPASPPPGGFTFTVASDFPLIAFRDRQHHIPISTSATRIRTRLEIHHMKPSFSSSNFNLP